MIKRAAKPKRANAQNRVKKRPRGKPFAPGNSYRIKPGEAKNPGGRPKLLGESYARMLARVNVNDEQGRTNAELIAEAAKVEGLKGNVAAMKELRQATEGDLLLLGNMSDDELRAFIASRFAGSSDGGEAGDTATNGTPAARAGGD